MPFKNVFVFPSCLETNGKVNRTDNHFRVMDYLGCFINQKITAEAGFLPLRFYETSKFYRPAVLVPLSTIEASSLPSGNSFEA